MSATTEQSGATAIRSFHVEFPEDALEDLRRRIAAVRWPLVSDANFACPALQVDRWTSERGVRTFAYQFNDDNAPSRFAGPALPPIATHSSEYQYLFDLPNAPFPGTLNPDQQTLAATMRAAWTSFAATGNPSTAVLNWPSIGFGGSVMSLVPPQPMIETDFSAIHHCAFWDAAQNP